MLINPLSLLNPSPNHNTIDTPFNMDTIFDVPEPLIIDSDFLLSITNTTTPNTTSSLNLYPTKIHLYIPSTNSPTFSIVNPLPHPPRKSA